MGTYGLDNILTSWKHGSLTTEQAIGQILQLLKQMDERLRELEQRVSPPRPAAKHSKPKHKEED